MQYYLWGRCFSLGSRNNLRESIVSGDSQKIIHRWKHMLTITIFKRVRTYVNA